MGVSAEPYRMRAALHGWRGEGREPLGPNSTGGVDVICFRGGRGPRGQGGEGSLCSRLKREARQLTGEGRKCVAQGASAYTS
eukprot:4657148-Pyramimonas_sp.AAC.2